MPPEEQDRLRLSVKFIIDRLSNEREGFQSLQIFGNGRSLATYRWGCRHFPDLEALIENREGESILKGLEKKHGKEMGEAWTK
jgi:hypothetical protein